MKKEKVFVENKEKNAEEIKWFVPLALLVIVLIVLYYFFLGTPNVEVVDKGDFYQIGWEIPSRVPLDSYRLDFLLNQDLLNYEVLEGRSVDILLPKAELSNMNVFSDNTEEVTAYISSCVRWNDQAEYDKYPFKLPNLEKEVVDGDVVVNNNILSVKGPSISGITGILVEPRSHKKYREVIGNNILLPKENSASGELLLRYRKYMKSKIYNKIFSSEEKIHLFWENGEWKP
ncbi:MAG: hypothetical protein GXP45_07190 [bacterium]|nr:hypothetical protein [bacterium]